MPILKLIKFLFENVFHCSLYRCIQIAWYLSSLTLHTAVVGTVWPLLGSHRNRQATLHLFQKYLLCWQHEYIVSRNKITCVKVTFCVFFYNWFLLKLLTLHFAPLLKINCTVLLGLLQCFLNALETAGAACAVLHSWPTSLFNGSSYLMRTIGAVVLRPEHCVCRPCSQVTADIQSPPTV